MQYDRLVRCPSCGNPTRVLESRRAEDGAAVRRRRRCPKCGSRFTTFERLEPEPLAVIKRDGKRQGFDRVKLRASLLRAAHKRPVAPRDVEALVTRIEHKVAEAGGELEAERIGEMCLTGLRELDIGAYLQFAAVYKQLADLEAVRAELRELDPARPARPSGGRGNGAPSPTASAASSVRSEEQDAGLPPKADVRGEN
jgi:transcriptional repressor NrdR